NNQHGEASVSDTRALIYQNAIPCVQVRYRSLYDRFDNTQAMVLEETSKYFSLEEQQKILEFARAFGLDYGDMDILRDRDNGKIYIVDVNPAPSGPRRGIQLSAAQYDAMVEKLSAAFMA